MSTHRIKIESASIMATQVVPTWSGEVDQTRQNDGVFFRDKVGGEFQFKQAEYTTIKDAPDCEKIEIYLEEKCGVSWVEKWRGKFTTYDVKFDENKCLAKVAPKTVDDYDCFMGAWATDHVVSSASAVVEARPFPGTYEVGQCCMDCLATPPVAEVCAVPADWCFMTNFDNGSTCANPAHTRYISCFHRVIGIGVGASPPTYGTGWTHIIGVIWWRCPTEVANPVFDQGRVFNDVLEYLIDQSACGLTVRSHFLGINATHDAPPSNIAYDFATAKYQSLQLHQKSDVKRPFSSDPAQSFVWKMSAKKLLEDLAIMWNVFWKIDGTDLIIEHISYFEAATGIDMTQKNIKLEYGKQEGGAPNIEVFKWMDGEATFTTAHAGYPISYGDCGDGSVDRRLNYFSNDIFYIANVENPEEIADAGFCLVATEDVDGDITVIDENVSLGWVDIHENLHKHNRYFSEGNMNDTPATSFLSTRKTRKLEPFQMTVCCDDAFSPEDSIATLAGVSEVQKATINYFAGGESNLVKIEANI